MDQKHLPFSICVSERHSQGSRESSANSLGRSQTVPSQNFNCYLWENIAKVIPHCLHYRNAASQQFFEVATLLFRSTGDEYYETLDVSNYVREWSRLLLEHEHDEVSSSSTSG